MEVRRGASDRGAPGPDLNVPAAESNEFEAMTEPERRRMILCGGLQSGGTTLISWCFLQRRDTNGVLDMAHDILHGSFKKVDGPVVWLKMTIGAFRWLDAWEYYRDRGWAPEPLLVVRDARTAYASLMKKVYGFDGLTAEEPPLRMRFRRFLLDWHLFRERDWPIVKFEDFLDDPRTALAEACRSLRLPWDEAMLSWPKDISEIAYVLADPNRTFASSLAAGSFRSTMQEEKAAFEIGGLPASELEWLEETFAAYNAFHGYPRTLRNMADPEAPNNMRPPQYRGTQRQWYYDEYVRLRSENERRRGDNDASLEAWQRSDRPVCTRQADGQERPARMRPLIAFFDFPDVFEDFYPHYGVDQAAFATRWADTGSHRLLALVQREIGDVVWYPFSLRPQLREARHPLVGCRVRFSRSSRLHSLLWQAFYQPRMAWRWRRAYRAYATLASYTAPLSMSFLRTLWRDRPDAFLVQDFSSGKFDVLLLLARMLGVPLIVQDTGGDPGSYFAGSARRWTLARADCVIACGADVADALVSRYGVPQERVAVVLTPIDTRAFRPLERSAACRAAGLDPGRRYLLFVGRLQESHKRVSVLIRAFAELADEHPDTDLLIVGEGGDGDWLRDLAAELAPDRVRFLGWLSGATSLTPLYSAAECLVLPSLKEGFPTVVGEAMACGRPVVAFRVGGVGELVREGETGWLLQPGDDGALRGRLSYVLAHPDELAAMRPRARRAAENRVSPAAVVAGIRECFAIARRDLVSSPETTAVGMPSTAGRRR
jgi:glycosyltransferase involved in cell wall biosynthesis